MNKLPLILLSLTLSSAPAGQAGGELALTDRQQHGGVCSASGAVAVGSGKFLVADDEDNCLRLYDAAPGGRPLQQFELDKFLKLEEKGKESDLEAATWLNGRVFWITSHGNNSEGEERLNRRRLFATTVREVGGKIEVEPQGKPYRTLLNDLLTNPKFKALKLGQLSKKAPEKGGINIEGLTATPDNRLLIGFRSPLLDEGKALLVTLRNPDEVVNATAPAAYDEPRLLDLGGLGVRSIEYIKERRAYLIIAGPDGSKGEFRLYEWQGGMAQPRQLASLSKLLSAHGIDEKEAGPEALFFDPRSGQVRILLDEGDRQSGGVRCKDLDKAELKSKPCKDSDKKHFTSFRLVGLGAN